MDSTVKTPSEDWDEILSINLRSVFYACKAVLKHMIDRKFGVILNCSSINGVIGCGADAYTASKGGINALSRALAVDNAKYNILIPRRGRSNCRNFSFTAWTYFNINLMISIGLSEPLRIKNFLAVFRAEEMSIS